MAAHELWVEKYRPSKLSDYVFKDEHQKTLLYNWVNEKNLPNCLFSGTAGVGKTTLAKVLINELEINDLDVLELNASRTNSVDDVRNTIINFIQMMPFGDFKVVLLDECDFLSISSQSILRGVFEEYHNSARFILTANYPQKIIPALHSRCQGFHIEKIDHVEYTTKVATILLYENIEFDLDILDTYVKAAYPDLRKCINMVQMNSINGTLRAPDTGDSGTADYKLKMVELFKNGKIQEARKLICSQARQEDFEDIYTWLYQNIELFGDTDKKRDNAILHIKQALVDHTICADSEINFSALMIKLIRNME
jgi:DNA polymerase III delta prime subunit